MGTHQDLEKQSMIPNEDTLFSNGKLEMWRKIGNGNKTTPKPLRCHNLTIHNISNLKKVRR